jgi:hypothetical protein
MIHVFPGRASGRYSVMSKLRNMDILQLAREQGTRWKNDLMRSSSSIIQVGRQYCRPP